VLHWRLGEAWYLFLVPGPIEEIPFRTDTVQDRVTVDMGLSVTVEEGYRYIIVGACF
jgi:hypothetical protein